MLFAVTGIACVLHRRTGKHRVIENVLQSLAFHRAKWLSKATVIRTVRQKMPNKQTIELMKTNAERVQHDNASPSDEKWMYGS